MKPVIIKKKKMELVSLKTSMFTFQPWNKFPLAINQFTCYKLKFRKSRVMCLVLSYHCQNKMLFIFFIKRNVETLGK